MAHPLQCKAIASAQLKNDKVDAATLARLLRSNLLPEVWIAPQPIREQRALLRHRAQLVRLHTLLRNRIHAMLAHHGCDRASSCWSAPGQAWLAALPLPAASRRVVTVLETIDTLQQVIDRADATLAQVAKADARVKVLHRLPGVGPLTAVITSRRSGISPGSPRRARPPGPG
ncbi:hypothetical protein GCM10010307_26340 [Streptomyces vastus]|uniref:Transposase IS110-like N-terminal domain-containing protein n=2 Tax=Streptomyces vastus TaxID=285451 RepID=A0ABN3QQL3_9ACTN